MSKIEPMTVEMVRYIVGIVGLERKHAMKDSFDQRIYDSRVLFRSLILAFAYERARANLLEYISRHSDCESVCLFDEYHVDADHDWLNEVLDEISWPKEYR